MFNNDGNDNKVLWLVTKTVQYSGPNPMSLVQDLKDNGKLISAPCLWMILTLKMILNGQILFIFI